jgi:hypothetical protein
MKTIFALTTLFLGSFSYAQNLAYPCKEAIRRQSTKPTTFEKDLQYFRSLVNSGQNNFALPDGLDLLPKIEAAISDLSKNNCPATHPEVASILNSLQTQQKEVSDLYLKLKALKDSQAKRADIKNYAEIDQDLATLEYLFGKYNNLESLFENLNYSWIENKITAQLNIKNPIMDTKRLKVILQDMYDDGDLYNALVGKYSDLIKNNPTIENKFKTYGNPVLKNLSQLYETQLPWLHDNLSQAIKMNFKVIEVMTKEAVDKKNPVIFKSAIITPLQLNSELINLLSLSGKKGFELSQPYKSEFSKIQKTIQNFELNLAEQLLKEQRLGTEKYSGSDRESIRLEITKKFKELHPRKELIKIQLVNESFQRHARWNWNNSSWYKTDYSDLGFYAVVKIDSKVAELVSGWLSINHMKQNQRQIWFEFSSEKELYQNPKILIKNL